MKKLILTVIFSLIMCVGVYAKQETPKFEDCEIEHTLIDGRVYISISKKNIDILKHLITIYESTLYANQNRYEDVGENKDFNTDVDKGGDDVQTINNMDDCIFRLNQYYYSFVALESLPISSDDVMRESFNLNGLANITIEKFKEDDRYEKVKDYSYKMVWLNECLDDEDATERNKAFEDIKLMYEEINK